MSDWRPADWLAMMVIVPNVITFVYVCVRIGWIKRREIKRFVDELARPFDEIGRSFDHGLDWWISIIDRSLSASMKRLRR